MLTPDRMARLRRLAEAPGAREKFEPIGRLAWNGHVYAIAATKWLIVGFEVAGATPLLRSTAVPKSVSEMLGRPGLAETVPFRDLARVVGPATWTPWNQPARAATMLGFPVSTETVARALDTVAGYGDVTVVAVQGAIRGAPPGSAMFRLEGDGWFAIFGGMPPGEPGGALDLLRGAFGEGVSPC